jgi:hypothetical protein
MHNNLQNELCRYIAVTVSTFKDITANGNVYENRHYLWDTLGILKAIAATTLPL